MCCGGLQRGRLHLACGAEALHGHHDSCGVGGPRTADPQLRTRLRAYPLPAPLGLPSFQGAVGRG
eukprot:2082376-Alexandrium_andersonii.AAC.1